MSDLERKHILLVEDEAIIAMTEKMQLEKYGYSVRTVTTGEKAVNAIKESPDIDLILMDINLGKGIDGTQAAAFILEDRDIPIVFLSSHTEPDVVEKTEKITSYGYVVKNSSATVLDASIKMAFKLFEAKVEAQKKEESLRQSEEKYRLQFMHMNSYNSMYDVVTDAEGRPCDFRFLMVNQAYEQYVGKEACELIGKTLLEVFPHTEQYWIDKMIEVVTTGEPSTYENYSSELDTYIEINLFTPQQGRVVMTSTNVTERKRIERELNESILRHRELESRIPVGVYILWIRANGTKEFEYVSDRWCELHGVGRERVIADSSTVDNLVYPDDRARFFEQNRVAAEERKPFRWEGRFLNGDGETRWFRIESTPFLHEDGDTRWFGVIQDITERKQAEENYLSLFNYSNDAIFVHELGDNKLPSKNIDVNEQAVRLLGYTKEELLNLSAKDVVPEEHASDMLRHAHELMEKKHLTFESENIRSDGVVIPVEVSAYLHTEGNKKLVISSVRDITERKQVEKELTDQKQHLETILETTADGFWVVAPDKRITRVNAAYCRMSGYSNEELTNMEINCIEAIEHPEDTDARMKRIQETGSEVFETKHRRKDGSLMDIEVSASSLEWDNGVWLVCFCRDITERKQAENAITALITEKETLINEIKHRIKNSISTMTSLLSLQIQTLEEPTAITALEDARNRMSSLGELYEHLYSSEAIEKGSIREYMQRLVASEISLFPHGNQITVHSEIQECICTMKTLSTTGLIVNELVTNAMKYAFVDHEAPQLALTGTRSGNTYILTIEDNGPGGLESADGQPDSGFGLMIVKALTEQLGGSIRFESNTGTKAEITFPIAEEPRSNA